MKLFLIYFIAFVSLIIFINNNLKAFPIPKNNEVKFDIIRKGKDIGDYILKKEKELFK